MMHHDEHREVSPPPPETKRFRSLGIHRISGISSRALLALTMLCGGAAKVTSDLQPVEQPTPLTTGERYSLVSTGEPPPPSPDNDVEEIFQRLDSHTASGKFLEEHIKSEMPAFPFQFLSNYRPSPQTMLKTRKSACNGRGNWNGERLARQGVASSIVSLCPADPVRIFCEPWHQVLAVCIRPGERYLIFDNNDHEYLNGNLRSCLAQKYPSMMIMPGMGGVVPWKRTSETVIGSFSPHANWNTDELQMQAHPELDDPSILENTVASAL